MSARDIAMTDKFVRYPPKVAETGYQKLVEEALARRDEEIVRWLRAQADEAEASNPSDMTIWALRASADGIERGDPWKESGE